MYNFSRIAFHLPQQFQPQDPHQDQKNYKLFNGVLRSGNGAVDAKLCLERPIWPRSPKKGVTQWCGQPRKYRYLLKMTTNDRFPILNNQKMVTHTYLPHSPKDNYEFNPRDVYLTL